MRPNQQYYHLTKDSYPYEVKPDETVYYQFVATGTMSGTGGSPQEITIYPSYTSPGLPTPNVISSNFVYTNLSFGDLPDVSNRNIGAPSTGGWSSLTGNWKLPVYGAGAFQYWNEWPIPGESNYTNLTIGNTYWFPFKAYYNGSLSIGWNIDKTGTHKVVVYRNNTWVTLTTTGKFTWTGVI